MMKLVIILIVFVTRKFRSLLNSQSEGEKSSLTLVPLL